MRVVHDRRRYRQTPDALTVEDLLSAQEFDFELVEDAHLTEPAHEPRKFLPPPRARGRREPQPPRAPENRVSKIAKLAGLTTAASLLVGAVVASAVLTRQRPANGEAAAPVPPQITGAAALGAFVPDVAGHRQDQSRTPRTAPSVVPTSQVPVAQTQAAPGSAASSAPATSSTPADTSTSDKVALVEKFYQRMVSAHPEDALAMLTPDLAGEEPGDLVRAWSSMSRIEVDSVEVQPDGTVRAVVTVHQHDGTQLRVTQVLTVTKGKQNVISRAVLLSAEQL
ncbi:MULTISPECIES: hypothetical protein [Amycolatopsis]|uniref:Uncharacterized protein n=1 Tax=Amycolatopsis sacchari TaxID=115433 RepID=A0A1I3NP23_9PSEU|nr:hypothetical protein [Amycolatopsis sacchari]SFJ11043.1 hypothetical protein SAMN05421835_103103 [Amycolatopsis sacchari]